MSHQTVIVLDFGGQYNQLIARRVRECGVYCEVKPYTTPLADIRAMNPIGIIFTGGPNSVYDPKSPQVDPAIFTWGVPILGICYGCQLMAHNLGGRVTEAQDDSAREYGKTETYFDSACKLFKGLPAQGITWMSHGDYMEKVPEGFALVAHSDACPNVAICDESRGFYGVQYHPEVNHTEHGTDMIRNFLYEVCGAAGDWTMGDYKETAIRQIREKVGDGKVLLALSGGVDSSVAAALVAEAVGSQLTCVFVDHGLMRLNEGDEVEAAFSKWDINLIRMNEEDAFLGALKGLTDPEDKRKAIGNPNKNIHHKKNGSYYQKDTGSMVRSTSARQEPEKMSTTVKVLIGVVFVALVAALVLRSTVWKDNVVAGAWMMVLVGAVCGLMYYVRKRYPGKRKVGGTMDTVISALLILFCVVYVGMGAMALVAMNK